MAWIPLDDDPADWSAGTAGAGADAVGVDAGGTDAPGDEPSDPQPDLSADGPVEGIPRLRLVGDPDEEEAAGLDQALVGFLSDFRAARWEPIAVHPPDSADGPDPDAGHPAHADNRRRHVTPFAGDPYAGSEVQVDDDWWIASDGRWYPPELHPDAST